MAVNHVLIFEWVRWIPHIAIFRLTNGSVGHLLRDLRISVLRRCVLLLILVLCLRLLVIRLVSVLSLVGLFIGVIGSYNGETLVTLQSLALSCLRLDRVCFGFLLLLLLCFFHVVVSFDNIDNSGYLGWLPLLWRFKLCDELPEG